MEILQKNQKIFKKNSTTIIRIYIFGGLKMTDHEEDVYDDTIQETSSEMLEDDEISPEEEAFLKGYEDDIDETMDEDEIDREFE